MKIHRKLEETCNSDGKNIINEKNECKCLGMAEQTNDDDDEYSRQLSEWGPCNRNGDLENNVKEIKKDSCHTQRYEYVILGCFSWSSWWVWP